MKLYLCEKPSQGKDIAAVLGGDRRNQGFIETKDGVVTWAIGHMVELAEPDSYNPVWKQWRLDSLPIVPEQFKVVPVARTRDQLRIVARLIKEATHVVVATDADREGEMIARELLDAAKYRGPISRLWLSALDEESIKAALRKIRKDEETRPLYYAALARSRSDWLVGMNMTRAMTIRCRKPGEKGAISIGRVQSPTLALVVRRDRAIEDFKPVDYFEIVADVRTDSGAAVQMRHAPREAEERILDRAKAEQIARAAQGAKGPIKVEKTNKAQPPPKLYSLAGFQMRCNALYGWSADKSLQIAQALYETHKATTYPRTDCEFLPNEQVPHVPKIVANLKSLDLFAQIPLEKPIIRKSVFNTAKVTAHHAIIPTTLRADLGKMSDDEQKGFAVIARSYLAALLPDYEYEQTRMSITAGVLFGVMGNVPQKPGWRIVYGGVAQNEGEVTLPAIRDGTPGTIQKASVEAKKTKPPDYYTEGTLLGDMRAIAKFVVDPARKARLKETDGIGTEATRANIIKTLRTREFLEGKGKKIVSTQKGRDLIGVLEQYLPALADAGETAIWEKGLEMIIEGKLTHEEFVAKITHRIGVYLTRLGAGMPAPAQTNGNGAPRPPAEPPIPTGTTFKGKEVSDCGDHYRIEGIDAYLRKVMFGRNLSAADYVAILEAGKKGKPFENLKGKSGKAFTGILSFSTKTKFNGRPGIELAFEKR